MLYLETNTTKLYKTRMLVNVDPFYIFVLIVNLIMR